MGRTVLLDQQTEHLHCKAFLVPIMSWLRTPGSNIVRHSFSNRCRAYYCYPSSCTCILSTLNCTCPVCVPVLQTLVPVAPTDHCVNGKHSCSDAATSPRGTVPQGDPLACKAVTSSSSLAPTVWFSLFSSILKFGGTGAGVKDNFIKLIKGLDSFHQGKGEINRGKKHRMFT